MLDEPNDSWTCLRHPHSAFAMARRGEGGRTGRR